MKIALAIEGGGMRGCVAAGMAAAISELGLLESFDAVYGASAGSPMTTPATDALGSRLLAPPGGGALRTDPLVRELSPHSHPLLGSLSLSPQARSSAPTCSPGKTTASGAQSTTTTSAAQALPLPLPLTLTLTLFLTPPLILPLPLPLPPNPAPYPYANPKQAERGDVHAATRLAAQQYETAGRVAEARRATDSARQKTDTLTFLHPAY